MAQFKVLQHALNVGVVDKDKLHRVDLERMRLAAEQQTNLMCTTAGPAFLRPGTEYIGTAPGKAKLMPFISGQTAAYLLELTDGAMRVYFDDVLLTRPAVTAAITNPTFVTGGGGWTLAATAGQSSTLNTSWLDLTARAHGAKATAKQTVTINEVGVEHALRIKIGLFNQCGGGPVGLRIGTADGLDDVVGFTTLGVGTHSLAFIPAVGTIYVQFESVLPRPVIVLSCAFEAAGVVTLPTIWPEAALNIIRRTQSLDVLYLAALGYRPQKIERRGDGAAAGHSWSVVNYAPDDGPFLAIPGSTANLTPSVLENAGTLTSDIPFFKPGHVGALFRLYHDTQNVDTYLAGATQYTTPIQVTGINEPSIDERKFAYTISGTWAGTIRNQRSFDGDDVGFNDYRDKQTSTNIDITANVTNQVNDDDDDNAIAYYRLGFPAGLYTSGEAHVQVAYSGGGGFGICRVTGYTSSTSVSMEVLKPFQALTATAEWVEGSWSDVQGYPTAVALDDGRMTWIGIDKNWASISDAYESFDIDFVGDAGPIDRAIALGGRNEGRWALPLSMLLIGTDSRVARAGASALEETVTPSNLTIRSIGKIGAAAVDPVELKDNSALFVEASTKAVYAIDFVPTRYSYTVTDFSKLSNEMFIPGITEMTVQTRPDQRVLITTATGDAITIVHEPDQQVTAFVAISTSAASDQIESRCVLPGGGQTQDREYRSVSRLVNGATVRTIERVALDIEARPGTYCKIMDAGLTFGAGSATISVPHLIGRQVVVWMDGAPLVDPLITDPALDNALLLTVDDTGVVTLPTVPTVGGFLGLPYVGRYKSGRLAYGVGQSSPVLQTMQLDSVGLLLAYYCRSGIRFGTEFDNPDRPLESLPTLDADGATAPEVVPGVDDDEYPTSLGSGFSLDSRFCLELRSPKPATISALLLGITR